MSMIPTTSIEARKLADVLEYLRANGYPWQRVRVGDVEVTLVGAAPVAVQDEDADEDVPVERKPKSIYAEYGGDLYHSLIEDRDNE